MNYVTDILNEVLTWCHGGGGYGLLYNWYVLDDARGIAPLGWHVATNDNYVLLNTFLGGGGISGGALKEVGLTHWNSPNTGATNSSGFTALGSGYRTDTFHDIKNYAPFWTSTEYDVDSGYICQMAFDNDESIDSGGSLKYGGAAVRFMRDTAVGWVAGEQITDYDGNVYDTVQIGTQIWAKQNLAVKHYNNGNVIPEITDDAAWVALTTGALCAYNNDWGNV